MLGEAIFQKYVRVIIETQKRETQSVSLVDETQKRRVRSPLSHIELDIETQKRSVSK